MDSRAGERRERRRDVRIAPKGTLHFRARGQEQHGRIANLSAGGVYIQANVTAPARLLRRHVEMELRLDAGTAEWLRATGRIVRIHREGVAIAFDRLAAPWSR